MKHFLWMGVMGLLGYTNTPLLAQIENTEYNYQVETSTDQEPVDALLKNGVETQYSNQSKLKSTEQFKNGAYSGVQRYYDSEGQLREEIHYVKGIKEGFTRRLHSNGVISYRGVYRNNEPYGKFSYHDQKGKTKSKGCYKDGVQVIEENQTSDLKNEDQNKEVKFTNPDYLGGGTKGIWTHLSRNIAYPRVAQKKKIEGKVIVGFLINKDGIAYDFHIRKSIHQSLDEEALRVVRALPYDWVPGTFNNEPHTRFMTLPVVFRLKRNSF